MARVLLASFFGLSLVVCLSSVQPALAQAIANQKSTKPRATPTKEADDEIVDESNKENLTKTTETSTSTYENSNVSEKTFAEPSAPMPLDEHVVIPSSRPARKRSADIRARSEFTASYMGSPLGSAVPFKHGPALGWIIDEKWTIEASYFTGSLSFGTGVIDVGSFSETLLAVQARYYTRNTFNWIFGISRQSYNAHLGSQLITRLSNGSVPADVDVLKVATIGFQIGLGNRWQWENGLSLGADWLVLNFPFQTLRTDAPFLQYVSDPNDRKTVEDVLKIMKYFPTGAVTKVSLGYTF